MPARTAALAILLTIGLILVLILSTFVKAWRATDTRFQAAISSARMSIDAKNLPRDKLDILLSVEDPKFFEHHGVDLATPGAGLTTITQALSKELYFDDFRPGIAKIKQTICALALDRRIDKWRQLDLFLNNAYMGTVDGRDIVGFASAAQVYFDKAFDELNREEFISMVAVLPAPNALNPVMHPDENARRVRKIERMLAGDCQPDGLRDVFLKNCGD